MIRWGILGAGKIAYRFASSLEQEADSVLAAISCRSQEKADRFAQAHPVEKIYIGYEKLLADPQIDAIYLALPHGLHEEWAIRAIQAGKAVLCEKPAALDAGQMRRIAAAARENQVLFMEAMKTRFVPLYDTVRQLVKAGKLGELTAVEASLCNQMPDEMMAEENRGKTYHTQPGQGGALLDAGIYCASWLQDFLPSVPELTSIFANVKNGVDYYVEAELKAGDVAARLECAFDRAKPRRAVLRGTKGYIAVEELHRTQKAVLYREGEEPKIFEIPYEVDDFYGEIHHFVECLKQGRMESPVMPLEASVQCAEILDIIRQGLTFTPDCLDVLRKQEEILQYDTFGSADALRLGNLLAALAGEYDRPVGIRIVRERDNLVLFQYMMDGKTERHIRFMEGKRATALAVGHSSLWMPVEHALNGKWEELMGRAPEYMPCGGAFPIRAGGEWIATVMVSGLHEGKDHELLVRAIETDLHRQTPAFPCAPV